MVAEHCSQIAARENTFGRHYSRFRPLCRIPHKQYQSLARPDNTKIAKSRAESAKFG
jgi:hypothetical protein